MFFLDLVFNQGNQSGMHESNLFPARCNERISKDATLIRSRILIWFRDAETPGFERVCFSCFCLRQFLVLGLTKAHLGIIFDFLCS